MEYDNVENKIEGCTDEYKYFLYKDAYKLIWDELYTLKQSLGLNPIRIPSDKQYKKIKDANLFPKNKKGKK